MDEAERDFWIALGLWGASAITVFGTGLYALVEGFYKSGVPFTALGVGLIVYTARHLKGKRLSLQHALFGTLILTWIFFGYDIYDRRHYADTHPPFGSQPLQQVYGAERKFEDETIIVDGKHFIDPIFQNVTLVYNGTAPVAIDRGTFVMPIKMASRNEVVTQTMNLYRMFAQSAGCHIQGLTFGSDVQDVPEAVPPQP
jgi:hypothetical protein